MPGIFSAGRGQDAVLAGAAGDADLLADQVLGPLIAVLFGAITTADWPA